MQHAQRYLDEVLSRLSTILEAQADEFERAVCAVTECIEQDRTLFTFGTGHSALLAMDAHYRAGGLAAACPILASSLLLHESAIASTRMERVSGMADAVLSRYAMQSDDVLVLFSNSGVNAAPVEVAEAAHSRGVTVIGIVAREFCDSLEPRVPAGRLTEIADVVLDNRGPRGDALVPVDEQGTKSGPLSTISGSFLLNAIVVESAARLGRSEVQAPVYVSSNVHGAPDRNAALVDRYRGRNPHL